jgi:hypothetical protein
MTKAKPPKTAKPKTDPWPAVFATLLGLLLAFSFLKFGNPVVLDYLVNQDLSSTSYLNTTGSMASLFSKPATGFDWIYEPLPVAWGYGWLAIIVITALKVGRLCKPKPAWLALLPILWLFWQLISSTQTINPRLTQITLSHMTACVVCYYLGLFALSRIANLKPLWIGLMAGFLLVLWLALSQHYGGLETVRQSVYEQPDWQQLPREFLKRVTSGRVYGTLVYPNALAGFILVFLPITVVTAWLLSSKLAVVSRGVIAGTILYTGLACLMWSGSRSGWLIALVVCIVLLFQLRLSITIKVVCLGLILVLGLTGFYWRHRGYFERGATSVSARFDYWTAAGDTFFKNPVFGTGPGTFAKAYQAVKRPESEMARLCHNDYLEQASDSGFVGFMVYSVFIFGSLAFLYRQSTVRNDLVKMAVWFGLLSWALQGLVEFGLYIPALAWPVFLLHGWLLGTSTKESFEAEPKSAQIGVMVNTKLIDRVKTRS